MWHSEGYLSACNVVCYTGALLIKSRSRDKVLWRSSFNFVQVIGLKGFHEVVPFEDE